MTRIDHVFVSSLAISSKSVHSFAIFCTYILCRVLFVVVLYFFHLLSSSNDLNWLPCIVIIFCFRCSIYFYLVAHEIEVFVSVVVGLRTD